MKKRNIILLILLIIIILLLGYSFLRDSIKMTGNVVGIDSSTCPVSVINPNEIIKTGSAILPTNILHEVPPAVLLGGSNWKRYYLSTGWTYMCSVRPDKNILTSSDALTTASCSYSLGADSFTYKLNNGNWPTSIPSDSKFWRRNYEGIYDTELIYPSGENYPWIISFNHGENKNENNAGCYQNTVHPEIKCNECYSGSDANGFYNDCWSAYSAFITMSHSEEKEDNNWGGKNFIDEGPIIWPSTGYMVSGKNNSGVRHPNSIIKDDYIYVFYLDDGKGTQQAGQGIGIKVARAPLSGKGLPGTFKTYYNNAFTDNALPSNFNKDSPDFSAYGGRASNLFQAGYSCSGEYYTNEGTTSFDVAKIKDTNYYLGVEQAGGWSKGGNYETRISFRISQDLVTWSNEYIVSGTQRTWPWYNAVLAYPRLLNSDLSSDSEVDMNGFYILGTCPIAQEPWYTLCYRYTSINISGLGNDCSDQYCDNNPADGFLDSTKTCSGMFKTWYQKNSYKSMSFNNNWAYVDGEWLNNAGNNWYWAQGNCSIGTYPRYIFINTTTGWAYGEFNCSQNGGNYCSQQPPTPTCTSFTYSSWTQCDSSARQTRAITLQSPSGCTGGTPENLIQQCLPPCTLSNWQSSDSVCLSSNTLTRTWTKIGNCNQTIGISKPNSETISCTYVPNVVTCTNFTYSNWSQCFANGIQNRSLIGSYPENCQAGNPILTQSCSYTAPIINQNIPINPNENQGDNSGAENNNPETDNHDSEGRGQAVQPTNNKTQEPPINLSGTNTETNSVKKFFIKLICKFSNLFNKQKYNSCVENYLEQNSAP